MVPEKYKSALITDGIQFMKTITEAYGPDEGMKLWKQISDVIDPELKGQIFFSIITGETGKLLVRGFDSAQSIFSNKIEGIKCIRSYTGMSLKEAKDICDDIWAGKDVPIKVASGRFDECSSFRRDMKNLGFRV